MSERANGRASGPVLRSLFLFVPDHSAVAPDVAAAAHAAAAVKSGFPGPGLADEEKINEMSKSFYLIASLTSLPASSYNV